MKKEDNGKMMLAKEIIRLSHELKDCRNELCQKCGKYRLAYEGACDGCRWKEIDG